MTKPPIPSKIKDNVVGIIDLLLVLLYDIALSVLIKSFKAFL